MSDQNREHLERLAARKREFEEAMRWEDDVEFTMQPIRSAGDDAEAFQQTAAEKTAFERCAILADIIDGLTGELERVREQRRELRDALEECVRLMWADNPADGWKDAIDAGRAVLADTAPPLPNGVEATHRHYLALAKRGSNDLEAKISAAQAFAKRDKERRAAPSSGKPA